MLYISETHVCNTNYANFKLFNSFVTSYRLFTSKSLISLTRLYNHSSEMNRSKYIVHS